MSDQHGGIAAFAMALVLGFELMTPYRAAAQPTFRVRPSISTTQVYDSNLLFTPSDREEDFITRVTPEIQSEYRSPLWTLSGQYAFEVERFAEHRELNSASARQQAVASVDYRATNRVTLAVRGEFARTRRPGELNPQAGLSFARAAAQRSALHSSLTRRLTPTRIGALEYDFGEDRLAGNPTARAHTATLGLEQQMSLRDALTVEYRAGRFTFGRELAESHVLNLGWTRRLTSSAAISIQGGPSVTDTSPGLDLSIGLRNRFKTGELQLNYARTQTAVYALTGIVETQSIGTSTVWSIHRALQLRLIPAFYRIERESLRADVARLQVGATWSIAPALALDASFDASRQDGGLEPGVAEQRIPRHEAVIRLIAGPPVRQR